MIYDSLQWADEAHSAILAVRDGVTTVIPNDPANADFRLLTQGRPAQADPPLDAVAPAVIADPD